MECLPLMMADDRILNQSLAPLDVRDPVLKARKVQNSKYIAEVMKEYAKRAVLVPWRDDEKARDAAVAGRGSNAA